MKKLSCLRRTITTLVFVVSLMASTELVTCKKPVIFSFGDSNTDTGAEVAVFGDSFKFPYGRNLLNQPSGRASDGRLFIDFMCENLTINSYLTPYLRSLVTNFSNGANFAFSGATVLSKTDTFRLKRQLDEFKRFRQLSLELPKLGVDQILGEQDFKSALYLIDIAQNDLSRAFSNNSFAEVLEMIPSFVSEIGNGIKALESLGANNFWIHNTGPMGCLAMGIKFHKGSANDLDKIGCISALNDAAKAFNVQLESVCRALREELGVTIVYVDIYSIKYEIIANYTTYGFIKPLWPCCEICGGFGRGLCENELYIQWDGVHYTEAANRIVSSKILSTKFSTPPLPLTSFFVN